MEHWGTVAEISLKGLGIAWAAAGGAAWFAGRLDDNGTSTALSLGTLSERRRRCHDQRYAGRQFEEVEPDLRRDWEASSRGTDSWERLWEAIREGWSRVRNT